MRGGLKALIVRNHEPNSIKIGFSRHIVTIFELLKHEDKYVCNNESLMKQGIHEMIPVLNKVILKEYQFNIPYCCISKTLRFKCSIQGSYLADS